MEAGPLLELEDITFAYDGRVVLEEVSLRVYPGELVGLVGPNGAGKTTLLRLALGLLRPTRGRVRLFGRPLEEFREWHRLGYVPQQPALHPGFPATVREVVRTGRLHGPRLLRRWTRQDEEAVEQAMRAVGLEGLEDEPLRRLSGGQVQRVFLARALAGQPQLLLLDEPTEGLDPAVQDQFFRLLRRLRHQGAAVVLVSHDVGLITREVTRLACLHRRLFYCGPPQEFGPAFWSQVYGHPVHPVGRRGGEGGA